MKLRESLMEFIFSYVAGLEMIRINEKEATLVPFQ